MRMMHYPPQSGPHDDRLLGIGAHTDYGQFAYSRFSLFFFTFLDDAHFCNRSTRHTETITILRQMDGLDALQVLNKQGECKSQLEWISPPLPLSLVVERR